MGNTYSNYKRYKRVLRGEEFEKRSEGYKWYDSDS